MVTPELLAYISQQLGQNVSLDDIQSTLIQEGWAQSDVAEAVEMVRTGKAYVAQDAPTSQFPGSSFAGWVFRIGFTSIFLVNAFVAAFFPSDFLGLVSDNFLVLLTGHAIWYVWFAGVNDLLLGVLILSGKWPRLVLTWASVWLFVVTLAKVIHLL